MIDISQKNKLYVLTDEEGFIHAVVRAKNVAEVKTKLDKREGCKSWPLDQPNYIKRLVFGKDGVCLI